MAGRDRAVRIAGCSGSSTDRRDALQTLAKNHPNDPLDVIIGDWMSEANMTARAASKTDTPDVAAYEPTFIEALEPVLSDLAKHRIKLAVNAGASDTEKLCKVVTDMANEQNLDLKVAWISGDEVMPAITKALQQKSSEFQNVYTGEKLADWTFEPLYAQAYLGGLGIAAAFSAGADIVVCGRVSDASLTIGAAVWWHNWQRDQLECLANSLIAGHLIECSSYVCGGNFTGFKDLQNINGAWEDIGYPIAEISKNGDVIIAKNQNSGGRVTVDTCTSQFLYEIQGPWYFNSDVVADVTSISFTQAGPNRVALHGIKALPPPPTTKAGVTAKGGYQAEFHWFIIGLDAREKASMMEAGIRRLLAPYASNFTVLEFSLHGSVPEDPKTQNSATLDFRVLAQAPTADDLAPAKFARPCLDPVMSTYPGATFHFDMRQAFPRPIYEYYVTTIPQSTLTHTAHLNFINAHTTITIAPPDPSSTRTYPPNQPTTPSPKDRRAIAQARGGTTDAAGGWAELPAALGRSVLREVFGHWGRTIRGPLGWLVHARSGDKGSDCNVGFWPARRGRAEFEWLCETLSSARLRDMLGKDYRGADSQNRYVNSLREKDRSPGDVDGIERFEFRELRAVHFLLRGHLDRGVSCTRTLDFLGKNTAEFLRARMVDLPVRFLERGKL